MNRVLDFPTGGGNSPGEQKPPETSGSAGVDPLNAADFVNSSILGTVYDGLRQQRNCSVRSDAEFERIEREIDWLRSELDLIRSFGAYLGEELKSPRTQDLPQL